jgi:hypothetical protein
MRCDSKLRRHKGKLETLPHNAVINFDQSKGRPFYDSHWAVWSTQAGELLDPDPEIDRNELPFRYLRIDSISKPKRGLSA